MTVRADHLALLDLVENRLPIPAVKLGAYGEALVPEMVELEDDRITLAAVHAWMDHEVVKEVPGPL